MNSESSSFEIFHGDQRAPHDGLKNLPEAPPWRYSAIGGGYRNGAKATHEQPDVAPLEKNSSFDPLAERSLGEPIIVPREVTLAVNAALILRRPLLVKGTPGVGKSALASAVAYELRMGPVLRWEIGSRTTVSGGLYSYDAIGRLHAKQAGDPAELGDFVRLGPLGTALYPTRWPRVLLVDEIDKGDIDLPNDLLNVLERGSFTIPELRRAKQDTAHVHVDGEEDRRVAVTRGLITCNQFPFIVMTSNGEREFPAPFLRRCIQVEIKEPTRTEEIRQIVESHLRGLDVERGGIDQLIKDYKDDSAFGQMAMDQLLNAVFLVLGDGRRFDATSRERIRKLLFAPLGDVAPRDD